MERIVLFVAKSYNFKDKESFMKFNTYKEKDWLAVLVWIYSHSWFFYILLNMQTAHTYEKIEFYWCLGMDFKIVINEFFLFNFFYTLSRQVLKKESESLVRAVLGLNSNI